MRKDWVCVLRLYVRPAIQHRTCQKRLASILKTASFCG